MDLYCLLKRVEDGHHIVQRTVSTENGSVIEDVEMKAVLKNNSLMRITTEGDGAYLFSIPEGSDLSLITEKNNRLSEGITTRDLILIQRHILSNVIFDYLYMMMCAEVNVD